MRHNKTLFLEKLIIILCTSCGIVWGGMSHLCAATPYVKIWVTGGYRYIESNGLPDHTAGQFPNAHNPNTISEQNLHYRVAESPTRNTTPTPIGRNPFGVAVNGIPFDPGAAEYWNNDPQSGWQYEALSQYVQLGMDQNNAHVQPNGTYHYHGIPSALNSALVGYAADGFPIYSRTGQSSYRLKSGTRPSGPGGTYDGRFVNDYEYRVGSGDLDQCNGREGVTSEYPKGTYYYVVTETFPFIPRCWVGTPDPSFMQRAANSMSSQGQGRPSMGQSNLPPQQQQRPLSGPQRPPHPHHHPPR